MNKVRFIDLFAGIGGNRKGFENAFNKCGYETECVFTSEIKPHACKVLKANYPNEKIYGDITKISANTIPDFDFLLAGFPCQAFSFAGKRLGFQDTRGTLFFEVERILGEKKPFGFILENVEGLVTHDREDPKQPIGKTLTVILNNLDALGYKVSWRVLNSKYFGVAQERKRIYIVGTKKENVSLESFKERHAVIADILESGLPTIDSEFTRLLMSRFTPEQLYGKSIKDKRGGKNNIHSWDIGIRGNVTEKEKDLLNLILTERRKKKWAEKWGIDWMDGMPLSKNMIASFYKGKNLDFLLNSLVEKKYLVLEHPKKKTTEGRVKDLTKEKGYNIVSGKLSFEINQILNPNSIAPTLVATDMNKLAVVDGAGIRRFTYREGLRLFGYSEDYVFDVKEDNGFDLLGNTVVVPVIEAISERLVKIYCNKL